MDAQKFPFTRLPVSCAKNVLRTMSSLQLVVFSLLSKKCKNQAISLNHPSKQMSIHFAQGLIITVKLQPDILRIGFYESHAQADQRRKKQLETPKKVTFAVSNNGVFVERCKWWTNQLGVKEWVEHLKLIFPNSDDIWLNFMRGSFRFNLGSVKNTFPNIHKLSMSHTGRFNYNQSILQNLLPTEDISISSNCFRDSRIPHRILIQNFSYSGNALGPLTHITLNDLLINNSISIAAFHSQISSKDFNRFLKLWTKGANPRMEMMTIVKSDEIPMNIVMKGIEHQRMPGTLTRLFRRNQKSAKVRGGLDFYRMDGTKATIGLFHHAGRIQFSMVVWYDNCIG